MSQWWNQAGHFRKYHQIAQEFHSYIEQSSVRVFPLVSGTKRKVKKARMAQTEAWPRNREDRPSSWKAVLRYNEEFMIKYGLFQSKSIWDRENRDEIGKSSNREIYWHSDTTGKLPKLQTTWMIYGVILTARKTVVLLKKGVDRVWPIQPICIETDLVEMCKHLASSFTWLAGRGKI